MDIKSRIMKLERFSGIEQQGGTIIFLDSIDPGELEIKLAKSGEEGLSECCCFTPKDAPRGMEQVAKGKPRVTGKEIVDPGALQ